MIHRLLAAGLGMLGLAGLHAQAAPEGLVGKPAPAFRLVADSGETVSLADYRGKPVVLAFFPKAFTPG